jgi:hypothetical protein
MQRTALIIILLVFAGIVASRINADALWLDEELTYAITGGGRYGDGATLVDMFVYMGKIGETSPPLYYLAVAGWARVVGWSLFAMRWFSLLWGVLTVAATYRLGTDISRNKQVGLYSAVLLASSAFFVFYAHEFRVYAMSAFFAVMCAVYYWRMMNGGGRAVKFGLVLSLVLLLYSHYVPGFIAVGLGLYHLLLRPWNKQKFEGLALFAIAAMITLLWFVVILVVVQRTAALNSSGGAAIIRDVVVAFGNGLWIVLPVLLVQSAWVTFRQNTAGERYMWWVLLLSVLVTVVADVTVGFLFNIRFLTGLVPFFVVVAAFGLVAFDRRIRVALLAAWIFAGLWFSYDWRMMDSLHMQERRIALTAMERIQQISREYVMPDDVAVLYFEDNLEREWINDLTFQYYLDGVPFRYTDLDTLQHIPTFFDVQYRSVRNVPLEKNTPYAQRLEDYVEDAPHVWLFIDTTVPAVDELGLFAAELENLGYLQCELSLTHPILRVNMWAKSGEDCI